MGLSIAGATGPPPGRVVRAEEPRRKAAGIHLFYLPAYCPELSRIEAVGQAVKYQGLPHRSFERLGDLKAAVDLVGARKAVVRRSAVRENAQLLASTP